MKIRLQQVGQFTCVPLPGAVVRTPGYQPGDEVEVEFEPHSKTIRIRPSVSEEAAVVDEDLPAIAEQLIQRHQAVLRELARL